MAKRVREEGTVKKVLASQKTYQEINFHHVILK